MKAVFEQPETLECWRTITTIERVGGAVKVRFESDGGCNESFTQTPAEARLLAAALIAAADAVTDG